MIVLFSHGCGVSWLSTLRVSGHFTHGNGIDWKQSTTVL
jgi:hypothetical protein